MGYLVLCLAIVFMLKCALINADEVKTYKGYKAFKIYGSPEKLFELNGVLNKEGRNETITTFASTELQALVSPAFLPQFENLTSNKGDKIIVVHEDFSEIITREKTKSRKRGGTGGNSNSFRLTEYHSIDEINECLKVLSQKYEGVYLIVGGQTYEKRKILGLRINGTSRSSSKYNLPGVFIESGIHGREWIAPAVILYFINELISSTKPEIIALRESFDWHIFPVTNPDGYQYSFTTDRMWRKSRSISTNSECRGADLNRNWDHNWGVYDSVMDPCEPEMYAGTRAFSEIETESLASYMRQMKKFDVFLAFHCDADCLLMPFADTTEHGENHDHLVRIGQAAVEYGYKVNGKRTKGPATPKDLLHMLVSGCSMDYAHKELNVPIAFTYELRGEMFGWPQDRIPEQGDEVTQMILGIMVESGKLGYFDFKV